MGGSRVGRALVGQAAGVYNRAHTLSLISVGVGDLPMAAQMLSTLADVSPLATQRVHGIRKRLSPRLLRSRQGGHI